jgi:hypothetical protein
MKRGADIKETKKAVELDLQFLSDETPVKDLRKEQKALEKSYKNTYERYQIGRADIQDFQDLDDQLVRVAETAYTAVAQLRKKITATEAQQKKTKNAADALRLAETADETTERLMMDYANEYQALYVALWVKAVLFVVFAALLYTPANAKLFAAAFFLLIVVKYAVGLVQYIDANRRLGSDVVGKTCADMPDGCCADGVTAKIDSSGSNCTVAASPVACSNGEYGCCPDGLTARTDLNGSNCADWCSATDFGCCPGDMVAKTDASGSNCKSSCAATMYGCCPGTKNAKVDPSGSNCA